MEQVSLEGLNNNILGLKKIVEELREILIEDEFELSDEVVSEIEESRQRPKSEFVSHKDVVAEFLDED